MSGRELLKFLQALDEKQLNLPIVASIPIMDSDEEDVYPSADVSVLPNALIGIRIPDARVRRRLQDGTFVQGG
jgi:hypothetical protein